MRIANIGKLRTPFLERFNDFLRFSNFFGFGVFANQPTVHSGGVRHARESLFCIFGQERENQKAFPVFETGTGNTRSQSRSLGREREIKKIIPVVLDRNGNTQISFPLSGTGTGNFKVI